MHYAPRNDFCLTRPRASDKLEVPATIGYGLFLNRREFHATPLMRLPRAMDRFSELSRGHACDFIRT